MSDETHEPDNDKPEADKPKRAEPKPVGRTFGTRGQERQK